MKIDNHNSAFKAGEEDCQEEGVASHRARELAQNAEVVFEGVAEADEFERVLCKRSVMSGRRPRTALFNSGRCCYADRWQSRVGCPMRKSLVVVP